MKPTAPTFRTVVKTAILAATSLGIAMSAPVLAQRGAPAAAAGPSEAEAPELYKLQPIPAYTPKKTPWGDPDLRGGWPIDSLASLPFQRAPQQGNRVYLTDEEVAQRQQSAEVAKGAAERETKANKLGMSNWVESYAVGRLTSLIVDPANGRMPDLTPYGDAMRRIGRSSWVNGQTFDWTTDFDSWDRCITRGFPASMLPFRYNNGIRIHQAPGMVVVELEMIHDTRIIYTDGRASLPSSVTNYMGVSRGHWEGNTLVVETSNIRTGAAPINMATSFQDGNTVPMSPDAKVVERFTLSGPNVMVYEMTYNDPKVYTAPFTVRMDIPRNDSYEFFEYACHEGDVQVRNYINSSRALRAQAAAKAAQETAAK